MKQYEAELEALVGRVVNVGSGTGLLNVCGKLQHPKTRSDMYEVCIEFPEPADILLGAYALFGATNVIELLLCEYPELPYVADITIN